MKTHGVKQQKKAHAKKVKRSIRVVTARHERTLAKLAEKDSASLAGMRKMVEQLGVTAVDGAVETDSPNLYGSEPPAV